MLNFQKKGPKLTDFFLFLKNYDNYLQSLVSKSKKLGLSMLEARARTKLRKIR